MVEVHPIAKMIAEKGVDSAELSMFSEEQRRMIYSQAADILLRLNKVEHAFIAMERAGRPLPVEQLKKIAENKILLGQHQEAYDLLMKTGQHELAEFVKANFL
jgi:ClpP class serine protease